MSSATRRRSKTVTSKKGGGSKFKTFTKEQLAERRLELFKLICVGVQLPQAIKQVAKKFECGEAAVRKDWQRREEWVRQVVQLEDNTIIYELITGLRTIIAQAWAEYFASAKAPEERKDALAAVRIGALRLAAEYQMKLLEALQSAGIVEKAPLRVETTTTIKSVALPFECDPIIRAAYEEYGKKLKSEHEERVKAEGKKDEQ
jgi:DNA-directed RNA polymerase subunit N (RpoN/RPB10)